MTFADKLAPARLWLPVLFLSWLAFAFSIVGVSVSHRALQKELRERADQMNKAAQRLEKAFAEGKIGSVVVDLSVHRKVVNWNDVAIWSFLTAIILLGAFAGRNLLAT